MYLKIIVKYKIGQLNGFILLFKLIFYKSYKLFR